MSDTYILQLLAGLQREEVEWHPTIDYELCNMCRSCFNFCPHGVYAIDQGKIIIDTPTNCILLCNRCQDICPKMAISFPKRRDLLKQISKKRKEKRKKKMITS